MRGRGSAEGDTGGERQRRREQRQRYNGDEDQPNRDGGGDGSRLDTSRICRTTDQARDKNGNMMLEGEELEGLRGREARADANGDKTITVDEIVAAIVESKWLSQWQGGGSRPVAAPTPVANHRIRRQRASGDGSKVYLGLLAALLAQ